MYSAWWQLAIGAASTLTETGAHAYSVADISAAASDISKTAGGIYAAYDPVGVSQLAGAAYSIVNYSVALAAVAPGAPLDPSAVPEAPWSRAAADQFALPMWQARASVDYLDPEGNQVSGIFTIQIPQVLPSTAGSLQAQMELRVTDMLTSPPGTGTPRAGEFVSLGDITLMRV